MLKTKSQQTSSWVDSNTAAQALGISPRHLRKLRLQGLFKLGKHYRIPSSPANLLMARRALWSSSRNSNGEEIKVLTVNCCSLALRASISHYM